MNPLDDLHDYQWAGIDYLLGRPKALQTDDMGLGRTAQALVASDRRGIDGLPVLVLCPNGLREHWARQIARWVPHLSYIVLEGSTDERQAQITAQVKSKTQPHFTIVNFESSWRIKIEQFRWKTVIVDEGHKLANRDSKISTSARRAVHRAKYAIIMSGTPARDRISDLWHLLHMIDKTTFSSYWAFANEFCEVYHNGWGWVVGGLLDEKEADLQRLLEPYAIRRLKKDFLTLPPKTEIDEWLELPDDVRVMYERMKTDLVAELGDQSIFAPTALAALTRLRQMVIDPSLPFGPSTEPLRGVKADAVVAILRRGREQKRKVVVFSTFSQAIDRLERRLLDEGFAALKITGGVDVTQRSVLLDDFKRFENTVLVMTTTAGGTGLDLTAASVLVHLNQGWSLADNLQADDRIYRLGQTQETTIIRLLARSSIDEGVRRSLEWKLKDANRAIRVRDVLD